MRIGSRDFAIQGHTYVMGILNVTPDSFSDGGRYQKLDQALYHVEEMITDGMDIVDVGGESTRPGYTPVTAEEEEERVIPVIEAVKSRFNIPISLDTCKAAVAKAGIEAGVDLINDIWGLKFDPALAEVIANENIACCLMHNRKEAIYQNYMEEVLWDLEETLQIAHQAGIADDKIILDPGVGFGKTYEHNLEIIDRMEMLHSLGYPLLLGASRKSVVGNALNLPKEERVEGTLVTSVFAVLKRAMFVRVHDVKENVRAIRMAEAIRDGYERQPAKDRNCR
ncbi:MAG: dihydropteroate synthase [Lachnospiraceae bacterium]|nr:dihydropteroate synthase [Lachnospiraceae bacterium]